MIPILFEATETSFATNGIARLRDMISCVVTEERNSGVYECDFEYPLDGAHFEDIIPGRIIGVTHDETGDIQPFDIVGYSKPINGVATFHAVHISYRQSFLTVTGSNISSLSGALDLLTHAAPENPFSYSTDMTSSAYLAGADGTPKTVRQLLGGSEGSILDSYGGEYEWDKFSVKLLANRGQIRDFTIRYGINMTDYTDDSDYFGAYNSCIPFWNGQDGPVIGGVVNSGLDSYMGRDLCVPLDLTDKFENAPTTAQLEAEALAYMLRNQTNLPQQNIKVDFLRLQDFSGYEGFENLLQCNLCDTISVVFPKYGMTGAFKIVRTVYDVLEGRYIEMELGALRTSLSEALGINGSVMSSGHGGGGSSGSPEPTINTLAVSSGGSGTWYYRTWPSGWQEAWYKGSITFSNDSSAVGGWYRSTQNFALPISFADDASVLVSGAYSGRVFTTGGIRTNGTQFEAQILGGQTTSSGTRPGWNVYVAGYGRS